MWSVPGVNKRGEKKKVSASRSSAASLRHWHGGLCVAKNQHTGLYCAALTRSSYCLCFFQNMAKVQVNNVVVLDNPSPFYNPFQFEITFECIEDLSEGE